MVRTLIYVSAAVAPFTEAELERLLEQSRRDNLGRDITGLLLYSDGNFIQVLEGERETVDALFAKISRGTRHHHVTRLLGLDMEKRQFPDWSMGYRRLSREQLQASVPNFNRFMEDRSHRQEALAEVSHAVRQLLGTFIQTTRS